MASILDLLAAVQKRYGTTLDLTGRGLGIALAYFKAAEVGPNGDALTAPWLMAGVDEKKWVAARKDAESKLIYRDDAMVVTAGLSLKDAALKHFGTPKRKDASALTAESILDFEGIATSKGKDRDGDVMEPIGAEFDPAQPLLLHHNPTLPVGKLVNTVEKSEAGVLNHWAMANTPLANDNAPLVEFGAYRLSIGFQPVVFKAIEEGHPFFKSDETNGWHVEKSYVMETSLVTVPANVDAIITQFSREKFSTTYMKAWSKSFFDARPIVVKGGYDAHPKEQTINLNINVNTEKAAAPPASKEVPPPAKKEGDNPPPPEEKPGEESKDQNPAISAIEESLKTLAGLKDLPQEATDRLATMTNMLGAVKDAHDNHMDAIKEAAESGDIGAIQESLATHGSEVVGGLARLAAEMGNTLGVNLLTDDHKAALTDACETIGVVHAAFGGLSEQPDDDMTHDADDEETEYKEDEPEEEKDIDQTETSLPATGDEVAADDDHIEGWDGDGKSADEIATKLIASLMLGKKMDIDTLESLKSAVDEQLDARLDEVLTKAMEDDEEKPEDEETKGFVDCPQCGGSGEGDKVSPNGGKEDCETCGGSGTVYDAEKDADTEEDKEEDTEEEKGQSIDEVGQSHGVPVYVIEVDGSYEVRVGGSTVGHYSSEGAARSAASNHVTGPAKSTGEMDEKEVDRILEESMA